MNTLFRTTLITFALALWAEDTSAQPVELTTPAGAGASVPFLFASNDALLLSWFEPVINTDRVALRFARLSGGKWSEARTIAERNDFFVNWADFPSIVEDRGGALYAHWPQKSGKEVYAYDVRMAISNDGGRTWNDSFALNRDGTKTEHGFASLAPLPAGGVAVAWLDGRKMTPGKEEGEMTLRYARVDAKGVVTSEVELDARICECCTTGMAVASGGPVIAYRDRSADEVRDIAVVNKTARGWSAPHLVRPDGWKINGCPVNGPQVDAMGNRVAAAWFTGAAERGRVYVAFSEDGGAHFKAPVAVDEGKPLGRVDITMLDSQSALVIWSEQTAAGAEIRARRVGRDHHAAQSVKIADSSTARAAGFPRMARIGRDVFVAWTEQSAATKRVHVARVRY
jgi:hypothetical protein